MSLKEIRNWDPDRMILRLGSLRTHLEDRSYLSPYREQRLDECVVILLEILRIVIQEKSWDSSPLKMFRAVYDPVLSDEIGNEVLSRFEDTKNLVERFKFSGDESRKRLRPQLIARGMI